MPSNPSSSMIRRERPDARAPTEQDGQPAVFAQKRAAQPYPAARVKPTKSRQQQGYPIMARDYRSKGAGVQASIDGD